MKRIIKVVLEAAKLYLRNSPDPRIIAAREVIKRWRKRHEEKRIH